METKNIQGTRIGRWLVLEETDKRDVNGGKIFHCICDCGTKKDMQYCILVNGKSTSCGCLKENKKTKKIPS
jgi:hypothetical protein